MVVDSRVVVAVVILVVVNGCVALRFTFCVGDVDREVGDGFKFLGSLHYRSSLSNLHIIDNLTGLSLKLCLTKLAKLDSKCNNLSLYLPSRIIDSK